MTGVDGLLESLSMVCQLIDGRDDLGGDRMRVDERDVRIIGGHIGALDIRVTPTGNGWEMQCPACREWAFGPTMELHQAVGTWLDGGHLPAGALLAGACLDCGHATDPKARDIDIDVLEAVRALAGGWTRQAARCA